VVWKALTRIPWQLLVDHAPTIVDAARRMYVGSSTAAHRSGRERTVGLDALRRAVDELEAREVRHAAVLEDLAKQVQDLTMAIEVLRARLRWAWIGAVVAMAVAVATALFLGR
jgi:hypothetical protein